MTADQITRILIKSRWSVFSSLCVPRSNQLHWESDLLVVNRSGYCDEVEIKISAADFRREFTAKADKHRKLIHGVPPRTKPDDPLNTDLWEARGQSEFYRWHGDDWGRCETHHVRRFWFAMPFDLARKLVGEIPDYAGLLSVGTGLEHREAYDHWSEVYEVKKAPNLKHSRKVTDAEQARLLKSTYHRFWGMALVSGAELPFDKAVGE